MLGAWEFTIFGNISMGVMALAGVCSMVYAVGSSLSSPSSANQQQMDDQDLTEKKAA